MPENPKKTFRFRYLIDKEFQLKFLAHYSLLFISGVLVTLIFLYWLNQSKYDGGAVFRLRQDAQTVYWKVENEDPAPGEAKENLSQGKFTFQITTTNSISIPFSLMRSLLFLYCIYSSSLYFPFLNPIRWQDLFSASNDPSKGWQQENPSKPYAFVRETSSKSLWKC